MANATSGPAAAGLTAADLGDLPSLLTIAEVRRLLGVHDRSVRRWIAEQRLRAVRAGGRLRILRGELVRFLAGTPA